MRCIIFGHTWGAWSRPEAYVRTYIFGPPCPVSLQFRTCARCGTQQDRIAEVPYAP